VRKCRWLSLKQTPIKQVEYRERAARLLREPKSVAIEAGDHPKDAYDEEREVGHHIHGVRHAPYERPPVRKPVIRLRLSYWRDHGKKDHQDCQADYGVNTPSVPQDVKYSPHLLGQERPLWPQPWGEGFSFRRRRTARGAGNCNGEGRGNPRCLEG
jgi:hypothetical protein